MTRRSFWAVLAGLLPVMAWGQSRMKNKYEVKGGRCVQMQYGKELCLGDFPATSKEVLEYECGCHVHKWEEWLKVAVAVPNGLIGGDDMMRGAKLSRCSLCGVLGVPPTSR